MREFVDVEELLNKNLLAELPVQYFDGTPVKGQTVKVYDEKLKAAIEKCTKYNIENKQLLAKWEVCEYDGLMYVVCSNCKMLPRSNHMSAYCPNCGTRMRGIKACQS